MSSVYLCLGGNMGNREKNLEETRAYIAQYIGQVHRASAVYETAAWGKEDEPDYLNQVLEVHTSLPAKEVLQKCLDIEKRMGRTRAIKWEGRSIDIDILFYDREVIHEPPSLVVPHPHLQDRLFVLIPLQEIAPDLMHPVLKRTITQLAEACSDPLPVHKKTL